MKLAIMQPYFFPYIGYYQTINAVDKYILYDNLYFIKGGWINRNRILVYNNGPTYINARCKAVSSNKKIREIQLVENPIWRGKILKGIYRNYKRSLYFNKVYELIESIVNYNTSSISKLNFKSIIDVSTFLDLKTQIITDVSKYNELEKSLANSEIDYLSEFNHIRVNKPEKKVIRALEICYREKADIFINAIGGQKLYDKSEFEINNIELFFLKTDEFTYRQRSDIFYPNLSIIDVLMNCGKEGTKSLLEKYTLV